MHGEFKIGDFTIQPRTSTISKEGKLVRVEPKVMDLLVYLARHAGEPVEKERFLRDVWGGSFVTEEVLSNSVWKLRQIFGDDPRNPCFIETIQKKGYRLLAPVCFPKHHNHPADLPHPTVGHEEERAELQVGFNSALSGRGLLLCVSGEAGIGKTTFIQNFLYPHADNDCFVGRGKCSERLAGTGAYLPILEALDSLTHSGTDLDLVRHLRHTAPCWYVQAFPHAEDASAISAQIAGSTLERMKRELTGFFREVSDIRPLLLFFDDVHWADASSVDVWTYLCDRCPSMRILILASYRPELLLPAEHIFVPLKLALQAQGICREIPLSLLTEQNVASYIDLTFPGHRFPQEFVHFIYLLTEGNPLFMVGLLAHLRHQQVICPDAESGCWTLRKPLSEIEYDIPDSVHGLIDLRIRLLGDDNRRLLVYAAIQGHEFDSAVLARALGADQSDVEEQLEKLDRLHGFVRRVRSPQSPGQSPTERYQFVHVLYLNILCESLGSCRQASVSGAVAKALLEVHGERTALLTSHLAMLFETAREFVSAAKYFLAAAQQAMEVSADPEALTLARRGLSLLDGFPDEAERDRIEVPLRLALALALTRMRGYGDSEVREAFTSAYKLCRDSEDKARICNILVGLVAHWLVRGELKNAREIAEQCLRIAESDQDRLLLCWSLFMTSLVSSHGGELGVALEQNERCLQAYRPDDHKAMIAFGGHDIGVVAWCRIALTLCQCGYPDRARSRVLEAVALARKFNEPYTLAFTLFCASWAYRSLGDTPSSLSHAEEAIAVAGEHGFQMLLGWSIALRGGALSREGRLQEGIEEIERGLSLLQAIECRLICTEFLTMQAEALARQGNFVRSLATLDDAIALMESGGERYYEAEMYRTRAEILLLQSFAAERLEAESWLQRAMAVAQQQGSKSFELRAATTLAHQYAEQGRSEEGYGILSPVYGWFTEGFETTDLRAARDVLEICLQGKKGRGMSAAIRSFSKS